MEKARVLPTQQALWYLSIHIEGETTDTGES